MTVSEDPTDCEILTENEDKIRKKNKNIGTKVSTYYERLLKGVAVVIIIPVGKYAIAPTNYLSKSTQFAIVDTSVKIGKKANWVVRLDKAHKGVDFSHININKAFTGLKDPHARIPDGVAAAAGGVSKTLKVVGKVVIVYSLAIDTYRIGSAVRVDMKKKGRLGKETGKTVASVGSGYAGGAAGAFGGNAIGGWVGGGVGALFGGVGAIPGAAFGSILGGMVGGIGGAIGAIRAAEKAVEELVSDSDDCEDFDDEEGECYQSPNERLTKTNLQMTDNGGIRQERPIGNRCTDSDDFESDSEEDKCYQGKDTENTGRIQFWFLRSKL